MCRGRGAPMAEEAAIQQEAAPKSTEIKKKRSFQVISGAYRR